MIDRAPRNISSPTAMPESKIRRLRIRSYGLKRQPLMGAALASNERPLPSIPFPPLTRPTHLERWVYPLLLSS